MSEFTRYEATVSDENGTSMDFKTERYNELVYNLFGYLDGSKEDCFFFTMCAFDQNDEKTVLCNVCEGAGPIPRKNLLNILSSYRMYIEPVNNTIFDGVISKCGNSYVLKITEQCRMMGLDIGDSVRVKMERINTVDSKDNIKRLFYRRDFDDVDKDRIYVDEPEYLDRFLRDYRVKGIVSLEGIEFDFMMDTAIDHEFAVRTEDGNVILVSQPYNKEGKEVYAKAFADAHGLEYDYINEYSWYHRGDTKLIIFWLKDVELKKSE